MRQGPSAAKMDNFNPTSTGVTISSDGLTVENTGNDNRLVKCNVKARSGKWFFEVKLVGNGLISIGWINEHFTTTTDTLGDDANSWCYDANKQRKICKGNPTWYGEYCSTGDTLATSIDLEEKKIHFYRNGRDLGLAYEGPDVEPAQGGVWPAACLQRKQKVTFNFGKAAWSYPPPVVEPEFKALHCPLSEKELDDLNKLFGKYKAQGISLSESGETGDVIKGSGFLQYGKDLGVVEDSDPGLMILAWKLDAKEQWEFNREEFVNGWVGYSCATLEAMKKRLSEWREDLKKTDHFRKFYFFVFDYLKEERKTIIMTEDAQMVWQMLGLDKRWAMWEKWVAYLAQSQTKSISRDNWRQFYDFINAHPKDISNYDTNSSWPVLMDGFVEFMTEGDGKD